jgi:hypothetical protein
MMKVPAGLKEFVMPTKENNISANGRLDAGRSIILVGGRWREKWRKKK